MYSLTLELKTFSLKNNTKEHTENERYWETNNCSTSLKYWQSKSLQNYMNDSGF